MRRRHLFEAATETVTYSMPHGSLMTVGPPRVYDVVVSHAGDRVAFTAGPDPFRDIYVMGIDDARQTRLTDSLGDFMKEGKSFFHYGQPKFSPDDRMLLFQILHGPVPDNNDVAVISAAGGPVQALGEGCAERAVLVRGWNQSLHLLRRANSEKDRVRGPFRQGDRGSQFLLG